MGSTWAHLDYIRTNRLGWRESRCTGGPNSFRPGPRRAAWAVTDARTVDIRLGGIEVIDGKVPGLTWTASEQIAWVGVSRGARVGLTAVGVMRALTVEA